MSLQSGASFSWCKSCTTACSSLSHSAMSAVGNTPLPTICRRLESYVLILLRPMNVSALFCAYEDYMLDLTHSRVYSLATHGLRLIMSFIDRVESRL